MIVFTSCFNASLEILIFILSKYNLFILSSIKHLNSFNNGGMFLSTVFCNKRRGNLIGLVPIFVCCFCIWFGFFLHIFAQ